MNEQQQLLETLIEFLGDVFGVQGQTDLEKLTGILQALSQVNEKALAQILQATQLLILLYGITKLTKQSNPSEWNKYVATFLKLLGVKSATPMAKLGGILNYINKLNTIR